jgi:hypothetical protein
MQVYGIGVGCSLATESSLRDEGVELEDRLSRELGSFSSRCRSNGLAAASPSVMKDRGLAAKTEFVAL